MKLNALLKQRRAQRQVSLASKTGQLGTRNKSDINLKCAHRSFNIAEYLGELDEYRFLFQL